MCQFQTRVHCCGHYTKALLQPCEDAKKAEKPCSGGSEYSMSTGGWCYLPECDKEPGLRREGLGELILLNILSLKNLYYNTTTGRRTDGDFDENSVDWSSL